jgi:hypothetical protein
VDTSSTSFATPLIEQGLFSSNNDKADKVDEEKKTSLSLADSISGFTHK